MNLFFDTETTGLPPKGARYYSDFESFPHIAQIAWHYHKYYNFIIKPNGWSIPDNMIHGITHEYATENGTDFNKTIELFINHCNQADQIIAHNIYFDTSVIKANIIRTYGINSQFYELTEIALDKHKRFDTMYKTIKLVNARKENGSAKLPTLEELHIKLFNESFQAHNALEDVKALKRCYDAL